MTSQDENRESNQIVSMSFPRKFINYLNLSRLVFSQNIRWNQSSNFELEDCENKIFKYLKNCFKTYYVDVSDDLLNKNNSKKRLIHTIEMKNEESKKLPIVLLHGFAAGIAFWTLNLDEISNSRTVYALDLLGFGRSSRPDFSLKPTPEYEIVKSIEKWRKAINLNKKFVLVGHSFGAYIAMSYAIKYPDKVDTLVLADPWGFSKKTVNDDVIKRIPFWVKQIIKTSLLFNPLAILRISGPLGPKVVLKRVDLKNKFIDLMGEEDSNLILKYVYQCNSQKPSGEYVFKNLINCDLSAKYPMIDKLSELNNEMKLYFIYGSHSWLFRESFESLNNIIINNKFKFKIIENSGHHVYSDNYKMFNHILKDI